MVPATPSSGRHFGLPHRFREDGLQATLTKGALEGRLKFAPVIGKRIPTEVWAAEVNCHRCKRKTRIVLALVFKVSAVLPGFGDFEATIYQFVEGLGVAGRLLVKEWLPENVLREHGIGELKSRYSRMAGGEYLSNGCVHCDAIQGQFFDHDYCFDAGTVMTVDVDVKAVWVVAISSAHEDAARWWFDI